MEATVQNHLHASINFRSGDMPFVNFARHTSMDASLKLLPRKISPRECQCTTNVPGDE
jgi:hypothetical protein